ncbi:hypothetical protein SAMN04489729_1532 [Amycolatopsis lurida]|uniref:Uncharacterized protein n=1 Tax=Amycolatopsis lurida NRRL 2430 TaxID=1460371 RepID=A0A2P2FZ65_AMYLU|nr:hypothetical protein [Amycolatopsis lurida]KFU82021.1 hypothetical protein BB31_06675 [Amycolatopsis lurida NRRL 2430]SEC42175.1 hypothetical protein SAMN04489729_1532 [Amycolatopsis lurida]
MRSHTVPVALSSVFALALMMAGTASADPQEFSYLYYNAEQEIQRGSLVDPPDGDCIEIPEVAAGTGSAFRPDNSTGHIAYVYKKSGCEGLPAFVLTPYGKGSDRLTFRSVAFL